MIRWDVSIRVPMSSHRKSQETHAFIPFSRAVGCFFMYTKISLRLQYYAQSYMAINPPEAPFFSIKSSNPSILLTMA